MSAFNLTVKTEFCVPAVYCSLTFGHARLASWVFAGRTNLCIIFTCHLCITGIVRERAKRKKAVSWLGDDEYSVGYSRILIWSFSQISNSGPSGTMRCNDDTTNQLVVYCAKFSPKTLKIPFAISESTHVLQISYLLQVPTLLSKSGQHRNVPITLLAMHAVQFPERFAAAKARGWQNSCQKSAKLTKTWGISHQPCHTCPILFSAQLCQTPKICAISANNAKTYALELTWQVNEQLCTVWV